MQLNALYLLLLAAAAAQGAAFKAAAAAPVEGYGVFIPQWEVQATSGGETLLLSGTVEEVRAQLLEINPEYEASFGLNSTAPNKAVMEDTLQRDDVFKNAPVNCEGFEGADRDAIARGARYLMDVSGKPANGAGPNNCGRVSCSWNSAIWWCNSDTKPVTLNSFRDISDGAYHIIGKCYKDGGWISGQAFHKDNWNVIAKKANC
ncbi:hypothetical protein CSOJ01_11865 [Colletotrichum sojae]|uniref:Secreted protein n=1 Tax=Colletotrichum sojae TaxID=2175907 RepID=A0A8H6IWX6_9PEZI|nr:hypothetical protein CSOJ01_11865 [Colletotrichum sojae]